MNAQNMSSKLALSLTLLIGLLGWSTIAFGALQGEYEMMEGEPSFTRIRKSYSVGICRLLLSALSYV